MSELHALMREALPEIVAGLIVAAILGVVGALYTGLGIVAVVLVGGCALVVLGGIWLALRLRGQRHRRCEEGDAHDASGTSQLLLSESPPRVFISYAREDKAAARKLYADLKRNGARPWLDEECLLAGQKWEAAIGQAIRGSRHFLALLSSNSVAKSGFIQKELGQALDILDGLPETAIFVIPVRLDNCVAPDMRLRGLQRVDMFPVWRDGLNRILRTLDLPAESEAVLPLDSDPEELRVGGPSGGRQPRSKATKELVEQAGRKDDVAGKHAIFMQVARLDPDDPVGYRLLAWASATLGEYRAAVNYDEQALQLDKGYAKAYVGLIISGNRMGDPTVVEDGWAGLQTVCDKARRPFHEGAYWYADFQERLGNSEGATGWFQHIAEGWWKPQNRYEVVLLTAARRRARALERALSASAGDVIEATYRAHVAEIGWLAWVADGSVAGTTGQARRMEALELRLTKAPPGVGVSFQAHVADVGWMLWVSGGETAGTTGEGLRMEAVRIVLVNAPPGYGVTYQVHVKDIGWMSWASDGEVAGTTGHARRMEAIRIRILGPQGRT